MEFFQNNNNLNLFFRSRLAQLKTKIIAEKSLDAFIVIFSYDSLNNINILKFNNWLLFGYSSILDLEEKAVSDIFNETFLIITKDQIYVFSSNDSKEFFYHLFSKIDDMTIEYDFTTKKEEENSEYIQIIKIAKFLEQTYKIKRVGIPLLKKEKNNMLEVEKWPLINVYGLDALGEGFFTLKHEVIDISPDLEKLYQKLDLPSCVSLVTEKAYKLENTLSDFFTLFDREPIDKRLERSECTLNENQELDFMLINYSELKNTRFSYYADLPEPRVLIGTGSNKTFEEGCSPQVIYKTLFEYNIPSFHMTYENFDAITGVRFGRTYFLAPLQKEYIDYNERQEISYFKSAIYDNTFYLFNIYFNIISYIRTNQFDIVSGKISINECKTVIRKKVNDFIEKDHSKTAENYDYFIKEDNVLVNLNEYQNLSKVKDSNQNRVIVLRVEVKDISSVFTSSRIGSVLFCDSFLVCNEEIFNLTHDIVPFKYFFTSNIHHTGQDKYNYDPMKILTSSSPCKFRDIETKGIAFYRNFYNIPYLFPDSSDIGYDNNQLFLSINGKMIIYENYIVIYDNSLGYIIIDDSNVKCFSYKDEIQYTLLLVTVKDESKLPLSGIIKNDILLFLPGKNERAKEIKYNLISYLKSKYNTRVRSLSPTLEEEYELAIRTISENEFENLNYISNSFNITNIQDRLNEMYEFEYLFTSKFQREDINYLKYQTMKESLINTLSCTPSQTSTKLIFLFGTTLDSLNVFSRSIKDLGRSMGIKSEIIFPENYLINNEKDFYSYYFNSITELSNKGKVIIVTVNNEVKVLNFLYKLISLFQNFFDYYHILNISYTVNYNTFIKSKNKNLYSHLYNIVNEGLINFLFVDEGYITRDKVERNNKIISSMNQQAVIYNTRSFTTSAKEMHKIFGKDFPNVMSQTVFQFYNDFYLTKKDFTSEEFYFEFKYRVRKEFFVDFLEKCLNVPLKYSREKRLTLDPQTYMNMSDQEFQIALVEEVKRVKSKAKEPIIEKIVGFVRFIEDKEKNVDDSICSVRACYKEILIEKDENFVNNKTQKIGLLIAGKNIKNNIEYLNDILHGLSGEIPGLKNYRTKADLSEEEIFNLNLVNFERDLPQGWTTDGPVFLDENDNRYAHHPNLDLFIKEYLVICNSAVDEHNRKVSEEIKNKYLI